MRVADVIADGLARAGTARVFAVAGDRDADALREAARARGLSVVEVARADVACVMAGMSGTLSGAPGAALIGDDLAGAVVGITSAFCRRAPAIVIGHGASAAAASGLEALSKATLTAGAGSAAHWIAHGCRLAMTEPWGPVHLDVPSAVAVTAALPVATNCLPAPLPAPDAPSLDSAVRWLESAERPLVVVGRWCRSEADAGWVRAFAEARPAPVLVTPGARGVLPDPHPLVIGTLGAGDAERTMLESADLIVAIAVDPTEVLPGGWPRATPVLVLTPVASDAHFPEGTEAMVVGDIGLILEELAPRLRDRRLAEWDVARLHALKQAAAAPPIDARELAAFRVVEIARRLTPAGTLAVFDGGDLWSAAARAWQAVAPGEMLIAGGDAEGFAIAAAAAAQLARPDRRVVCFTDPAALGGARGQLETVTTLGLPVPIVVFGAEAMPATAAPTGLATATASSTTGFATIFETALTGGTPALILARGAGADQK